MGAFLAGLLERARGTQPTVAPRRRSAFEPAALEPPAGPTSAGLAADLGRIVDVDPAGPGQSPAGGRTVRPAMRVPAAGSPGAEGFLEAAPASAAAPVQARPTAASPADPLLPRRLVEDAADAGRRARGRKAPAPDAVPAPRSAISADPPATRRPADADGVDASVAKEPVTGVSPPPAPARAVARIEGARTAAHGREHAVRAGAGEDDRSVAEVVIEVAGARTRKGSAEAVAVPSPDRTERASESLPVLAREPTPASSDVRETRGAPAPAATLLEHVLRPPDAGLPRAPITPGPDERRRLEEQEPAPVIHVTIGRVEVRAAPPPAPPPPEPGRWQAPVLGLEEFLRRERGRS